jgi:Fe-S cluster assembly protein SufD
VSEEVTSAPQERPSLSLMPHSAARNAYRADFDRLVSSSFRTDPDWLTQFRDGGMRTFESLGFPTMRDEDWHFTSVAPIADRIFHLAEPSTISPETVASLVFPKLPGPVFVFVNGFFASDLSSHGDVNESDGLVSVQPMAEAMRDDSTNSPESLLGSIATVGSGAFTALNSAFFTDGAFIRIAPDAVVAAPIHLVFISSDNEGAVSHPRNLIVAGRNSRATVIESYLSAGDANYFTNAVTEVLLADGARLSHYKLQSESRRAFHVQTVQARQSRTSYFESFSFATGADLSRTNVYTVLAGDAAEVVMNGLYLADGTQHVDHQTFVEHVAPNCPSHELYKGVLDGRSHGVFNGKVYVHPEAQKTDGKQSNNNLLLSPHARVDTKPQLEIFADDVKCTHGATVGRLDETALFYLRSRGIGTATARKLLTYAFAADVLERLELTPLREALEARVLDRFTA